MIRAKEVRCGRLSGCRDEVGVKVKFGQKCRQTIDHSANKESQPPQPNMNFGFGLRTSLKQYDG